MSSTITVAERLARLDAEQRAAATAPPGPILCVAPAGSGKTSTLVARIAWLVDRGEDPATITALTFNRRAAEELSERLGAALPGRAEAVGTERRASGPSGPSGSSGSPVRVRTFHALGLEVLREAGQSVAPLVEREAILRRVLPAVDAAALRRLDTVISRFKLDLMVDAATVEADAEAGPIARAFVAYEREVAASGGLDFDDLVLRAVRLLEGATTLREQWRDRCRHLLVDEAQDLDRMQLRFALLLAAPANNIFLVGDDDQSIYGWRLADVRRLLGLAETSLPGLRRADLATNYRCPAPVVERAVRLVAHNEERFVKTIRARTDAPGSLRLAPSRAEAVTTVATILRSWPDDASTRFLARTNRELLPAVVACLAADVPFRARDLELPIESTELPGLILDVRDAFDGERGSTPSARHPRSVPLPIVLARLRQASSGARRDVASALLHWMPPFPDAAAFVAAIDDTASRLARLRRDDAALTLATVHGTKGLEFDHVAVIGLDSGRFPSARSIADAEDPRRALEEERRLAYVAWTRARRSLTLSYDPDAPSQFLLEAFDPKEIPSSA